MADRKLRCAVYTRKSTKDGLEQEFNSLDAQYEACAAYAVSQRHEGWVLNPERHDDGGFSGGNMHRPGLKRLMEDVAAGKVDIILLYKIDRLTRSLADFAKIVEVLDQAGASFVSITQSFNTTTSMGRLTLNMLLSFAQFEREVTGERKGKVRYRYYRTRIDLLDGTPAWHVSARDLEQLVCDRVAMFLGDPQALLESIGRSIDAQDTARVLDTSASLSGTLRSGPSLIRADLLTKLVSGVELRSDEVSIRMSPEELGESCGLLMDGDSVAEPIELISPATRAWHGRQLRLIIPGPVRASDQRHFDPTLVGLMREAYEARQLVLTNPDQSLRPLASSNGRCRNRLTRLIAISCLAPDIVVAILEGRQPLGFLSKILFEIDLPLAWEDQRRVLGFA